MYYAKAVAKERVNLDKLSKINSRQCTLTQGDCSVVLLQIR